MDFTTMTDAKSENGNGKGPTHEIGRLDISVHVNSLDARPNTTAWTLLFIAWLIAATATLGALFLGEVMSLPICVLCWYQRIFMFPLALILPVGLFPFDRKVIRYAMLLVAPGWLVAVYHQLLIVGVIPESIKPCTQGIPCKEQVIQWFGFVTIPMLSIAAFSTIIVLLFMAYFRGAK